MRKLFSKIHLWLSIPLGIIITIICLSGAILVFQDEIEESIDSEKYFVVDSQTAPLPVGKLIKIVDSKIEDNSVASVEIPSDPKRNYIMKLQEGKRASLYVNPYTGDIKGKSERGDGFFSSIQGLHRWLFGGKGSVGQAIVGYTTLFMVFILISGLIIWFPKNKKQIKKRFQIKTKYGIKRFWMDLHTTGGVYIVLGLLVLSLTGLYYSFDWYRKGMYAVLGIEMTDYRGQKPQNSEVKGTNEADRNSRQDNPNAGVVKERSGGNPNRKHGGNSNYQRSENIDKPYDKNNSENRIEKTDSNPNYQRNDGQNQPDHKEEKKGASFYSWNDVLVDLKEKNPDFRTITMQEGTAMVAHNSTFGNIRALDKYVFDNETGEITNIQLYKDYDGATKLRGWIYSIHTGKWGGIFSKILTCLVAVMGGLLPLTGYYIYFVKRRTKKGNTKKVKIRAS